MNDKQEDQMATMLGLVVGVANNFGVTPEQLCKVFSRKNILAAADIVLAQTQEAAQ